MEKLKLLINKHIFILTIFAFCVSLVTYWFSDQKLIASGEDGLFLFNLDKSIETSLSTWLDIGSGFATSNYIPRLPFIYFTYLVSYFGFEKFLYQALVFFLLIFTGCLYQFKLTSYLFNKYSHNGMTALISSFLYLFNPYSLTQLWNRQLYSQYFLFALLPAIMYFYIKGLREKNYKNIFYIAVFSFLFSTTFGLITNVIVLWSIIGVYTLIEIWLSKIFFSNLKYLFTTLIVFISTNLWWIIPFMEVLSINNTFSFQIDNNLNLETLEGLKKYLVPEYVSRLLQGNYFFSGEMKNFYSSNIVSFITYLSVFFVLISIYILRKDRSFYFLILLTFLSFFISIGSNEPTRNLFIFVFENVKFFQAFRNPFEKFGAVYMISFVILLSYCISLFKKFRFGNIVIIVFLISYLYVLFPVFNQAYISQSKIDIPEELEDLNSKMNEISKNKFIILPLGGEGHKTTWNYDGVDSSYFLFDRDSFSYLINVPFLRESTKELNNYITYGRDISNYASLNDISHIVIRKDILTNKKVDLEFETIQKDSPKEISCSSLRKDESRVIGKITYVCELIGTINFESVTSFLIENKDLKDFEVNLIDKNNKRIIFREYNEGYFEFENANQIEDGFSKKDIKELLFIGNLGQSIDTEILVVKLNENYKEKRLDRYTKIWENKIAEIYQINNLRLENQNLIEIERNSFFSPQGNNNIFLNKTYNSGWALVKRDTPLFKGSLIDTIKLYFLIKSQRLKPDVYKDYFNSWQVEGKNSYQIVFVPDVSFFIGVYLSVLSFLTITVVIVINDRRTKNNIENNKNIFE